MNRAARSANSGSGRRIAGFGSWIGPPLGVLSYFLYFVRFPALRDRPWIHFVLLLVAVALTVLGFGRKRSRLGRIGAIASTVVTSALLGLFTAYIFWFSFLLPPPSSRAESLERIPDLTLLSSDGAAVDLAAFRGRKLVIVFYRGFW